MVSLPFYKTCRSLLLEEPEVGLKVVGTPFSCQHAKHADLPVMSARVIASKQPSSDMTFEFRVLAGPSTGFCPSQRVPTQGQALCETRMELWLTCQEHGATHECRGGICRCKIRLHSCRWWRGTSCFFLRLCSLLRGSHHLVRNADLRAVQCDMLCVMHRIHDLQIRPELRFRVANHLDNFPGLANFDRATGTFGVVISGSVEHLQHSPPCRSQSCSRLHPDIQCAKVETLVGGLAQELVATSNDDSQCPSHTNFIKLFQFEGG